MARQKPRIITYFIIAVLLFTIGKVTNNVFDTKYSIHEDVKSIQKLILQTQQSLEKNLITLSKTDVSDNNRIWALMDSLSNTDNIYYLFRDSVPIGWSSSRIPMNGFYTEPDQLNIKKFANGWYLSQSIQSGEYVWLAINWIKKEYSYQNKFLSNSYSIHNSLNFEPRITLDKSENENLQIKDKNGNYLFSLVFDSKDKNLPKISVFIFLINILSLILILVGTDKLFNLYSNNKNSNYLFIPALLILFLIYLLFQHYCIPDPFYHTTFFSPSTFAVSKWLPSLANLEVFGALILYWSYWFYKYFKKPRALDQLESNRKAYYLSILLSTFFILSYFLFINDLIYMLVRNSSQASIFFNIEDLNEVFVFKLLILAQLFLAFAFVFEKLVSVYKKNLSYVGFFLISCLSYFIIWLLSNILHYDIHPSSLAFFLFLGGILFTTKRNIQNKLNYGTFILIVFLISGFNIYQLYHYNIVKEATNRELLIENLSFQLLREADPVAEMYLSDIESKLKKDETLKELLHKNHINEDLIYDHLKKNYFLGYWQRYEVQVTPCWPGLNLIMEHNDETANCYNYFQDVLNSFGELIPNSKVFYYLDNDNGQVSYFGRMCFFENDPSYETTLFFEINSKPTFSGLGYPELLTTAQEQINLSNLRNYSYANYIDGKLVKQSGTFNYPSKNSKYMANEGEKIFMTEQKMSHLIYSPNKNTTIVLSRHQVRTFHIMMAFSTFFILFFVLASTMLLFTKFRKNRYKFSFSIQERIQITFVSLLVKILVIMGVSSVYYSVYQFKQKNNLMLSQRIRSVLQEMEQKIINEPELDEGLEDYLEYLLQKFSNVFYSDINLYKLDGRLLATSRPELYDKGLTGRKMDPHAYKKLFVDNYTEYIHEETIGSLSYTSAYIPIYNYENKVLAYLNLPYFVGNNELKTEISSLIVAVVNAYLLFVLFAIGLAVVISRRITHPLILIQDRMAQIKLGQQNKKIGYKGEDEIGSLVKEYNRMVDELSESAEKLAKSERESAWREMAKQIAHEIKNPLTPMKLSVQYLLRAWDEQQDFESYLHRVSKTLIEQIDQLHVIANEFSNFAKMPQANRQKVNVADKLESALSLFEKTEKDIHFQLNIEGEDLTIFADNDQLTSVFNNLLKNAVQAIPKGKKGNINISVSKKSTNVHLTFSDNGRGMDDETKNKIFMPNFTTKSSGMGLGLSIVKNIVKNSGGEIWFETTPNIGTTFYVDFPLYYGS
ncbi:ATP-binding protein [Carboxylicivirga caseinilyticus]|uniref:sensor histidine kinase n=1 Tax=Carboxylicivirga caseinilyticus TaxID=3417572 RepID=UPI003D357385|nr:GHKL domain-containing protein [Marinilabiliaceae bacterium A049]